MEFTVGSFTTLQRRTHVARVHTPKGNTVAIPARGATRAQAIKEGKAWIADQSNVAQALLDILNAKRAKAPIELSPLTIDQL